MLKHLTPLVVTRITISFYTFSSHFNWKSMILYNFNGPEKSHPKKAVQIFWNVTALRMSVPVERHQIHMSVDPNVNYQFQSWYLTLMLKIMIRMIFYLFMVGSYFSCMKPTLYCQTIISISDSLPTGVVDIHKFSVNSLLSADDSKITYICYNLGKLSSSHI